MVHGLPLPLHINYLDTASIPSQTIIIFKTDTENHSREKAIQCLKKFYLLPTQRPHSNKCPLIRISGLMILCGRVEWVALRNGPNWWHVTRLYNTGKHPGPTTLIGICWLQCQSVYCLHWQLYYRSNSHPSLRANSSYAQSNRWLFMSRNSRECHPISIWNRALLSTPASQPAAGKPLDTRAWQLPRACTWQLDRNAYRRGHKEKDIWHWLLFKMSTPARICR